MEKPRESTLVVERPTSLHCIAKLLPYDGKGVEVGTNRGAATSVLMDVARPESLVLVDPWEIQPDYAARAFAFDCSEEAYGAAYESVKSDFGKTQGVTLVREKSSDALSAMENASVDWVYLDGCKYFLEVLADLEVAIAKLTPGGVVAGAGMTWGKQLGYPVQTAVTEIASRLGDTATLTTQDDHFAITLGAKPHLVPAEAKPSFLVISTMKNESPFILEWVAHYRAIGFTDFLIYTNDCDDTTDPLLGRLQHRGIVRHEPNEVLRRGPHKSALKYAEDHVLTARADWILICDVDEFLNIKLGNNSVQDLLDHLGPDVDAIPFPWQIFGCANKVDFVDEPITDQFTQSELLPSKGGRKFRDIKSMFRKPFACQKFGLHRPKFKEEEKPHIVWKTPIGDDISARMNAGNKWSMPWAEADKVAYMNHYPLRSIEAYLIKKNRGRANHVHDDLGTEYFDKWNLSGGQDNSISASKSKRNVELEALCSDPETLGLHNQGVEMMKAQLAELLEKRVYKRLLADLKNRSHGVKPERKRDVLRREMLASFPKGGKCAEVGVWDGRFSAEILATCEPEELHLIDPWEYLPEFNNTGFGRKKNADKMAKKFTEVSDKFKGDKRVHIHRATSELALGKMADGSLDWIYIDGNPNEPFVTNDLNLAYVKVKPDGIISGDDYYFENDKGAPVKHAVNNFVQSLGDKAEFERRGQQFIIRLKGAPS